MRRLVVGYAVLAALLDVLAALPGSNPSFSSAWGLVVSVLIQSVLIWRLSLGSVIAWRFGLLLALLPFVALALMGGPYGLTAVLFLFVWLAQAGVLLTPPIRGLVRQPPSAAA